MFYEILDTSTNNRRMQMANITNTVMQGLVNSITARAELVHDFHGHAGAAYTLGYLQTSVTMAIDQLPLEYKRIVLDALQTSADNAVQGIEDHLIMQQGAEYDQYLNQECAE